MTARSSLSDNASGMLGLRINRATSSLAGRSKNTSRTLPLWRRRSPASPSHAPVGGHCDVVGIIEAVTDGPVVGSLRQSCLAQALNEADAVLRPPERRRYPVKIAKPQRGIDLAQARPQTTDLALPHGAPLARHGGAK